MTDRINAGQWHTPVVPPGHINRKPNTANVNANAIPGQKSFQDILQSKLIRFSNHAELRLQQRGIKLDSQQLNQLESAIDKADAKGAKESLVVFKDVALIVNVKNRMVVTAMDGNQMRDNVFTQIDSAVIIP